VPTVPELPDFLTRETHHDRQGRSHWARPAFLAALAALVAAALLNVLGADPTRSRASAPAAHLTVEAPSRLRTGLLFQITVRVEARREIAKPRIEIGPGWIEDMTINTVAPEPADADDADGGLTLAYGRLPAGETLRVRLSLQVNPTGPRRIGAHVAIRDGDTELARVPRTVTVFP
jgi:hypothetical protein